MLAQEHNEIQDKTQRNTLDEYLYERYDIFLYMCIKAFVRDL